MRSVGVLVCLIALALTAYSAIAFKAPKIQADIQERVELALADVGASPIEVIVDGRTVTLRGRIGDGQQQGDLFDRVRDVRGALGPIDRLERLTVMSPYQFEAIKNKDGDVSIQGFATDADLRSQITADAQAIFGADVKVRIDLAAGAPEGDWRGIAGLGMDALATLEHGRIVIADTDVSVIGDAASAADIEAVNIFADAAPDAFVWTSDLSLSDATSPSSEPATSPQLGEDGTAKPFTFTIEKAEGNLTMRGHAPDEDTKKAIIDQAKAAASDNPIIADIQIAAGMPNANWPELVFAGIGAMAQIDEGRYDVIDNDVSFTGDLVDGAQPDEIEPSGDEEREVAAQPSSLEAEAAEISHEASNKVGDQAPPGAAPLAVTIYKADNSDVSAEGIAPNAEARDKLISALKEILAVEKVEAEFEIADGIPDEDWQRFVIDRTRALKAVKAGSLNIYDYEAHLIGVVDTPEDIDRVQSELAAIDKTMTADLNPVDPRPAAKIDLVLSSTKGVTIWGTLPDGLTEKDAATALGLLDYQGGMVGGGRGDAERWRQTLAGIGGYLPQFENVGMTIADDLSRVNGKIYQKGNVDQVKEGLSDLLKGSKEPAIDIAVTELVYENDTRRKNPLTGRDEVYDRGYWLPIATFSAGLEECQRQSSEVLAKDKITFLRGEATLDTRAEKIIDDLAAIVNKCLEGGLILKIGGHTDSRGATEMNKALSQERADAVMRALLERGVDAASLIAIGYGETQPMANNSTNEGRASNRRITFEWNDVGTEG